MLDIPRHLTQSGASPWQRGYVLPLTTQRIAELVEHFGLACETHDVEWMTDGVKRKARVYHVAGRSEHISKCVTSHILSGSTRRRTEPRDTQKGLWLSPDTVSFTLEALGRFLCRLDDHARIVIDRR